MAATALPADRIAVTFKQPTTPRQHRELSAFARYCIRRLEREVYSCDAWKIEIETVGGEFESRIRVKKGRRTVVEEGSGHDGPLAIWEAMCNVEERLREQI